MKPVIVIAAGGHAKVLVEILTMNNREIIGIVDVEKAPGTDFAGYKIIGNDEIILDYSPAEIELVNGLGSIPGRNMRWDIDSRFMNHGYQFSQVIHPGAVISPSVYLGEGVQIMAGAVLQTDCRVARSSIINTGAMIDHDCVIDEYCHIAPGVTLSGNVSVGKETHLGAGSTAIQNTSIGRNCVIAAGSVVYRNVPDNTKYYSNTEQSRNDTN